ncbi:MAG TPA: PRC-barrel domain-containing protein [Stellaceae bacterium]|nr:PRC-barrel domain-containing protein [Stellaceae bacterium]
MLWSASHVVGFDIEAKDGPIGRVADFLFDDAAWTVRWMEIDTGTWLSGRKVLIPPSCLGEPRPKQRAFPVELTRKQVEDSPDLAEDEPVSRQHEIRIYDYYGWEPYWMVRSWAGWAGGYPAPFGVVPPERFPLATAGDRPLAPEIAKEIAARSEGDPHLHSTEDVLGHRVHASDGEIGHIDDFLLDREGWAIRYLVVDTGDWWPGKKVLVAPQWMQEIDWPDRAIYCELSRAEVQSSPEFDPARPFEREAEERLHRHYRKPGYWLPPQAAAEDDRADRR